MGGEESADRRQSWQARRLAVSRGKQSGAEPWLWPAGENRKGAQGSSKITSSGRTECVVGTQVTPEAINFKEK